MLQSHNKDFGFGILMYVVVSIVYYLNSKSMTPMRLSNLNVAVLLYPEKNLSKVVCYCSLGYRSSKYAQLLGNLLKEQGTKGI